MSKKLTLKLNYPGLVIFCNGCKKPFHTACELHPDYRQVYKVTFYVPGSEARKTKSLKARNEKKAIDELVEFKKRLEENNYTIPQKKVESEKPALPETLEESILFYLDFLQNIGVEKQFHRDRLEESIKEVRRHLFYMENGVSLKIKITDFSSFDAGEVVDEVLKKQGKSGTIRSKTYDKYISTYRSFFKHIINKGIKIENHFLNVPLENIPPDPTMAKVSDYEAVLQTIETGNRYAIVGKEYQKKTDYYRPWLKNAIELGLLGGGRRREEIVVLKWTNIIPNSRGGLLGGTLNYPNLKVLRKSNTKFRAERPPVRVPITVELEELLLRMGYENKKNTDEYILNPERTQNYKSMMDFISKAFTHYYKQVPGYDKKVSFASLRKTYITYTEDLIPGFAKEITDHAGSEVIDIHYHDKSKLRQRVAKSLKFKSEPLSAASLQVENG